MSERTLAGYRILVVEDEYMLADDLCRDLQAAGAEVAGPVGTLTRALELIRSDQHLDAAVIDVNLRGEMAFPAADLLAERRVPFVFATGYDASAIVPRHSQVPRCEKPVSMAALTRAIGGASVRIAK